MHRRKVITADLALQMLESFRISPGNASAAAKHVNCDARTTRKAWHHGLRTCPDPRFRRPFQDIIAEEQEEVRARVAREEENTSRIAVAAEAARRGEVREAALDDITKQRAHEEQLVRNARTATIVLLSNIANLSAGAVALGGKVRASLEATAANPEDLSLEDSKHMVGIVGKLATSLRQLNDAGQKAMEMSRLLAGEPTRILGVARLEAIPMAEAKDRIAAASRAVAELEADGAENVTAVH